MPPRGRRPLGRFIGRERELTRVTELLAAHRLLSLVGPGGVGKTRLALELARSATDRGEGAVTFVELDGVTDAAVAPDHVAATCGVLLPPGTRPLAGLAEALGSAPRLLVLDNCEHLLDCVAELVTEVLEGTPHVRILLTSREPLGLPAEALYWLPPLGLPELEALPGDNAARLRVIAGSAAVQLFLERAGQILPNFSLDARNATAVAEICVRLDGLPLPIELAVAQMDLYLPEQLARRLDTRLDLLTRPQRGTAPRHQSLRALIDSSFELLEARQQVLFARLGVFRTFFSVAAAQAVCADAAIPADEVPGLLQDLTRRSLIQPLDMPADDASGRSLRMLESVREYARDQLLRAPELPGLRRRHLGWLLNLARELEPTLWDRGVAVGLARLDLLLPDIRAALDWAQDVDEREIRSHGLELAGLLWRYWELRGLHREAAQRIEALLEPDTGDSEGRVRALAALGFFLDLRADSAGMFARMQEAAELGRRLPFSRAFGFVLVGLALNATRSGQPDAAPAFAEELLAADAGTLSNRMKAWALYVEGFRLRAAERFEDAEAAGTESQRILFEVGDSWDIFIVSHFCSVVALRLGDVDRAERQAQAALECALRLETGWAIAACLELFSWIRCKQALMPEAARLMLLAERLRGLIGALLFPEDQAQHAIHAPLVIEVLGPARLSRLRASIDVLDHRACLDLARGLVDAAPHSARRPTDESGLTAREREIASLIGQGLQSPAIAQRLVLSRKTVDTHVDHIRRKLGLRSRSQIAAWWANRRTHLEL